MGHLIPITWYSKEERKLAVPIPKRYVPISVKRLPVKTTKRLFPRTFTAPIYIYGGGGVITLPSGKKIPRAGVWGRFIPEEGLYIPVDLKLLAIQKKDGAWIDIEEKPTLTPVYWRKAAWRASIPAPIRRKYEITPEEYPMAMLEYTTYVTSWDDLKNIKKWKKLEEWEKIPIIKVYHMGEIYDVDLWDDRTKRWIWVIPEDIAENEGLLTAMEHIIPIIPNAEIHWNGSMIELDFVIKPRETDKALASYFGKCRRNMRVRNYTVSRSYIVMSGKKEYPFLCEVRVYFISTPPREFYQNEQTHIKLIDALGITLENVIYFVLHRKFFPHKAISEGKLEEIEGGTVYEWEEERVETSGEEENATISYYEAKDAIFDYAIKEIYVYNITAFKKGKPYHYTNGQIETWLREEGAIVDKNGFVWSELKG